VVWNSLVLSLVLTSLGEPVDEVTAVSGDGTLIGGDVFDGQLPLGDGYRRLVRGQTMEFLQPLPGDAAPAQTFAMSRDGTVMVGFSGNPFLSFNPGPFIWTREMGTVNLDDFVRGRAPRWSNESACGSRVPCPTTVARSPVGATVFSTPRALNVEFPGKFDE
jgi:hypothetical protein